MSVIENNNFVVAKFVSLTLSVNTNEDVNCVYELEQFPNQEPFHHIEREWTERRNAPILGSTGYLCRNKTMQYTTATFYEYEDCNVVTVAEDDDLNVYEGTLILGQHKFCTINNAYVYDCVFSVSRKFKVFGTFFDEEEYYRYPYYVNDPYYNFRGWTLHAKYAEMRDEIVSAWNRKRLAVQTVDNKFADDEVVV